MYSVSQCLEVLSWRLGTSHVDAKETDQIQKGRNVLNTNYGHPLYESNGAYTKDDSQLIRYISVFGALTALSFLQVSRYSFLNEVLCKRVKVHRVECQIRSYYS